MRLQNQETGEPTRAGRVMKALTKKKWSKPSHIAEKLETGPWVSGVLLALYKDGQVERDKTEGRSAWYRHIQLNARPGRTVVGFSAAAKTELATCAIGGCSEPHSGTRLFDGTPLAFCVEHAAVIKPWLAKSFHAVPPTVAGALEQLRGDVRRLQAGFDRLEPLARLSGLVAGAFSQTEEDFEDGVAPDVYRA